MPRIAIISDLHANLEGLEAVFAHIDGQKDIEEIVCLGDVVGYGPDPEGVIDLVQERCAWTLLGNHDYALLNSPVGFNRIAAGAIQCQRGQLGMKGEGAPAVTGEGGADEPDEKGSAGSDPAGATVVDAPSPVAGVSGENERRLRFLQTLEEERWVGDDLFVHASPRDKIFEYILPEDAVYNPQKLQQVFEQVKRRCYVGHTHRPGVITAEPRFFTPEELGMEFAFPEEGKFVINVSSAGQPRDRDPRACYAVLEDERILWHRVEYDIRRTVRKVYDNGCLDNICGDRLLQGR
jgi:hypothetical protein